MLRLIFSKKQTKEHLQEDVLTAIDIVIIVILLALMAFNLMLNYFFYLWHSMPLYALVVFCLLLMFLILPLNKFVRTHYIYQKIHK